MSFVLPSHHFIELYSRLTIYFVSHVTIVLNVYVNKGKYIYSIGQSFIKLESGNKNVDGQTNKMNYTKFESNLAMMVIYLPVKFKFDWIKRF